MEFNDMAFQPVGIPMQHAVAPTPRPAVPLPPKQTTQAVFVYTPDRFGTCLKFTWQTDNDGQPLHVTPGDRGGATAWGVTFASFAAWRTSQGHPYPVVADLGAASRVELATITRANYWNAVQGDHLPVGVDLLVYDFGFGSGPGRAVELLQQLVGSLQDGQLGPKTLAAVLAFDRKTLIRDYGMMCDSFYRSLDDYSLFGHGWSRRNSERLAIAEAT